MAIKNKKGVITVEHTAKELIENLNMKPHYEGGWYAVGGPFGIALPQEALPEGYTGGRNSASHIYYMLQTGEESCWHVLRSAECWLWHCGGSLVTSLGGTGDAPHEERQLHLGPNLAGGDSFYTIVPAGQWQTTRLASGSFALVSCIVTPSFHDDDFHM